MGREHSTKLTLQASLHQGGSLRAGLALRGLAGMLWPVQEGNCKIRWRRKVECDRPLCHYTRDAGVERTLLWQWSCGQHLGAWAGVGQSDG